MSAYYNEHDRQKAAWLRELIKAKVIAPGEVDERSIEDVRPTDLAGFRQCHFFAGIGVWSYALRLAGWPDDRKAWTGSCPCQPFSEAGKGHGFADKRHLWPLWFHLIAICGPDVVFGEQVASQDGLSWLDLVQDDLEAAQYAVGAPDLCAAGFGAPHIRQRLFFVADSDYTERRPELAGWNVADRATPRRNESDREPREHCEVGNVGDSDAGGLKQSHSHVRSRGSHEDLLVASRPGPVNAFWASADWIHCRDEKFRPIEPGTFPLVDGFAGRVGLLRGYGDAIVAEQAAEFVRTYMLSV